MFEDAPDGRCFLASWYVAQDLEKFVRSGSEGRAIRSSASARAWLRAFSASSFVNND